MSEAVAALRAFTRASEARNRAAERCELCATPLGASHPHLFDASSRRLACACDACGTCFDGAREGRRWARIVPRVERLDAVLDGATWNALGVPVRLAYLTPTSGAEPLAILPSPAGPIESPLPTDGWTQLTAHLPIVSALTPDVEGILAFESAGVGRAYRMSVDHAYRAIGLLRVRGRGVSASELASMLEHEILPSIEREAH